MAEGGVAPGSTDPLLERYQAIEQAYCAGVWSTVLDQGRNLMRDLRGQPGETSEPLRQRLLLLLGHTHLHGFADPEAAGECYAAVLSGNPEAELRPIAEEGMRACRPIAPPQVLPVPAASEEDAQQGAAAAMPWLETTPPAVRAVPAAATADRSAAPAPLVPQVVEEPELIELHQADPTLAEEVVVQVRPAEKPEAGEDLSRGLLRVILS